MGEEDRLAEYFATWKAKGYSEEQISKYLISNGYPPSDVDKAMEVSRAHINISSNPSIDSSTHSENKQLTKHDVRIRIISGAIILIVLIALFFIGRETLFSVKDGSENVIHSDNEGTDFANNPPFSSEIENNLPSLPEEDFTGSYEDDGDYKIIYVYNDSAKGVNYTIVNEGDVVTKYVTYSKVDSCNDGIMNFDETGVDCGSHCGSCGTCDDSIQNGNESGIDCGGSCLQCECSEYSTRICTVENGEGLQIRNCAKGHFGEWSDCILSSCFANYTWNGSSCVYTDEEVNKNTTNISIEIKEESIKYAFDFIEDVTASTYDISRNAYPGLSIDGNTSSSSRWSGEGDGEWVKYKFTRNMSLIGINIFFYKSDTRSAEFSLEFSLDGNSWGDLGDFSSSGTAKSFETFYFPQANAKYFRIVGHGNSETAMQNWTSIREVSFVVPEPCTPSCTGKSCGTDGCGGTCGVCSSGLACNASYACSSSCVPNCAGKTCGTDGCGGTCGTCPTGISCTNGNCATAPTGKIYYLSPSGSDSSGNGSINNPWFTINKAWTVVAPGDTVYLRGGVYRYNSAQILSGKNGNSNNYINVWAYPGEQPILTKSSSYSAPSWPNGLIRLTSQYTYWKDIEIANFTQASTGIWYGFMVYNGGNNKFEQLNIHHSGLGMAIRTSEGNLVLNSDFHHNQDPLTADPYGNADGLEIGYIDGTSGNPNIVRGCRFYWNSDDGLDLWDNEGQVIIENSWSWYNGFIPDTFTSAGNGMGFKLGKTDTVLTDSFQRTITNCVSVFNKKWGFGDNDAKCNMKFYNNIAYNNCYKGFSDWCGGISLEYSGIPYYAKNNIAYNNVKENYAFSTSTNVNFNSWNLGVSVSDSDFESVDVSELDNPRKSDGSLPDVKFLHLRSDSDLINKGTNVNIPYSGTAPDLGAFETGITAIACTPQCSGKMCGDNGCGGSCGTCQTGYNCSAAGTCTTSCTPSCSGKECGDNGCGGSCGSCVSGETCSSGTCTLTSNEFAADYFVATNGSDSNPGTISQPFKTWQKAITMAQAGDLIYIRGGVYSTTGTYSNGFYNAVMIAGKSGTSSNPISIFAYPGEVPIMDCGAVTGSGLRVCIGLSNSNYWHLKGLHFRNLKASQSGAWSAVGVSLSSSNNNIIENVASYGHSGPGFTINGDNNLILNCDSHSNYDVLAGGENADGFVTGHEHDRNTNTFRGCRSYNNSDDGFDTYDNEGTVIFDTCWAFDNGYGTSGDGAGFKLGRTELTPLSTPQRIVKNSIAYNSRLDGFDQSDGNCLVEVYNNIAYKMGSVGFLFNNGENVSLKVKNNIGYQNRWSHSFLSNNIVTNNSWQGGLVVSDADFVSVDGSQLKGARKTDGSLPDITFLKLKSDSDLINKGVNVGLPYSGSAPDLGPFEYGTATITCTPSCSGKNCGSDGCGGTCGTCLAGSTCSTAGICITSCEPSCSGKVCGSDGCGGTCGTCSSGYTCTSAGTCTSASTCTPFCSGRECGDDGCGGSCGTCSSGNICMLYTCESTTGHTVLTRSGETTTVPDENGINIPRSTPTLFTYKNNRLISSINNGYMLQAGDESTKSSNNNLEGQVITGNYFDWNGNNLYLAAHSCFVGYQKDSIIRYNYFDATPHGALFKGHDTTNTLGSPGGAAYNIFKNNGLDSIPIKGMNNVQIYNNVFYSDQHMYVGANDGTWRGIIEIYNNSDREPYSPSPSGIKIKNNIFYTKNQIYMISLREAGSLNGFESDYNVYYCENGEPIFNYLGSRKTFAQWQALGFDTHSVVRNPNFVDFVNFVPSSRLNYGTNLGSNWQTGLSTDATWIVGTSPKTKNQDSNWQVGAMIY